MQFKKQRLDKKPLVLDSIYKVFKKMRQLLFQ